VVAFGATGAEEDVGVDGDADFGVGTSDDDGENDRTGSSRVAPQESETPPRGDSLCGSPRSTAGTGSDRYTGRLCCSWCRLRLPNRGNETGKVVIVH
ncbi:unnamed protein product, partial [Ascophyllum nodosum]